MDVRIRSWCFIIEPWASDYQCCFVAVQVDIVVARKVAIHDGNWNTLAAHNSPFLLLGVVLKHNVVCKYWLLNINLRLALGKNNCSLGSVQVWKIAVQYLHRWLRRKEHKTWNYRGVDNQLWVWDRYVISNNYWINNLKSVGKDVAYVVCEGYVIKIYFRGVHTKQ